MKLLSWPRKFAARQYTGMTINPLKLILIIIFHPLDAFDIIKRERKATAAPLMATALVFMAMLMNYGYLFIVNFQQQTKETADINLLFEMGIVLIPFITWVLSTFGLTAIAGGETTFSEIFTTSAYCLTPFIIFTPVLGIASHFISASSAGLFSTLRTLVLIWVAILLFVAMLRMNNYGFLKTVFISLIAVFFMVLICAVAILLIALSIQLVVFFTDFFEEIQFKYFY